MVQSQDEIRVRAEIADNEKRAQAGMSNLSGFINAETYKEKQKKIEEARRGDFDKFQQLDEATRTFLTQANTELGRQIEALQQVWDEKKAEDDALRLKQAELQQYLQKHLDGTLDLLENKEFKERVERENEELDLERLRKEATDNNLIDAIEGKVGKIQTSREQLQKEMDIIRGRIDARMQAKKALEGVDSKEDAQKILDDLDIELNTTDMSIDEIKKSINAELFKQNRPDKTKLNSALDQYDEELEIENYMRSYASYLKGDVSPEELKEKTINLSESAKEAVLTDEHVKEYIESIEKPESVPEKQIYNSPETQVSVSTYGLN